MSGVAGYVVVALLGAVVGGAELASRYRDDIGRSLVTPAAAAYVAANAGGSLAALYAARTLDWDFGVGAGAGQDLVRTAVAGLGALALFRTKLLSASFRGETHAFGPSRLLEQLLAVSDREIDRRQADARSRAAAEAMAGVSFAKAYGLLPAYVMGLLESVAEEDQERLSGEVEALFSDRTMDDAGKAAMLGVAVIRLAGPDLLRQAVTALGPSIR